MARSFNGSTQYLGVSTGAAYQATPYSLSATVRISSNPAADAVVCCFASSSSVSVRTALGITSTGKVFAEYVVGGTVRRWVTTASISLDQSTSLCATFGSTTSNKSYIDGNSTGAYSNTGAPAATSQNRFAIGAHNGNSGPYRYFGGEVSEVAVWDVSLAQAYIDMLAAGYSPLVCGLTSLVGYWPLHGRGSAAGNEEDWVGSMNLIQTSSPALADHPRIIYPRRRASIWVPPVSSGAPSITALSARLITATSAQPRISYS